MKKYVFSVVLILLFASLCACGLNFGFLDDDKPLHREDTTVINGTPLVQTTETETEQAGVTVPDLSGLLSSEWPDNEYTKLVPKPDFKVLNSSEDEDGVSVMFSGVTAEQMKAYAEKLKEAGFNIDPEENDQDYMGIVIYSFTASNADGTTVALSFAAGTASMGIKK